MKQREIAEIGIGQRLVEILQILGNLAHRPHQPVKLQANRPVHPLRERPLLDCEIPAREQRNRHIERLLGVMIALERIPRRQAVVGIEQIDEWLLQFVARDLRYRFLAEPGHAEDIEHQHAVVRHEGPSALGNDRRVRDLRLITHRFQVVDDVVCVLLKRVVDAGFEVGLRPVVVDPQPAANVHILQTGARFHELDIHAGRFVQGTFDDPDVRNLASQVKVQELKAIFHPSGLELFEAPQDFGDRQAKPRNRISSGRPIERSCRSSTSCFRSIARFGSFVGWIIRWPFSPIAKYPFPQRETS